MGKSNKSIEKTRVLQDEMGEIIVMACGLGIIGMQEV